jgi:membrane protein DedA with SNARE-associated domain
MAQGTRQGSARPARGGAVMVQGLVEHFTYAGLFAVLFLAGLGLPVPEEVPILAAGVLAHQAVVRWWIALPVCVAGVLAGDVVLYGVGRRWGEGILRWRLVRRVLTPEREETLRAAYRGHEVKILFTARHVTGLRAAAFLTAGIAGVPFWKFLAVDAGAATLGVPVTFGVAYLLTYHLLEIMAGVHRIERWLGLLALLALVIGWAIMVVRRSRRLAPEGTRAERGSTRSPSQS